MNIDVLERPDLVDVLRRLGLRTLGAFAELPASDVLARFGSEGLGAHRLASGLDERPPDPDPSRRPVLGREGHEQPGEDCESGV